MESVSRTRTGDIATIGWAGGTLFLTALVGIAAKVFGVIVAPGARGVLGGDAVGRVETASGTLAYALTAMLIALVCGGSFELARARNVNIVARGAVVSFSGFVLALVSPAVVDRLGSHVSLALATITSLMAFSAGLVVLRVAHTRVVGATLALLGSSGLMRAIAWMLSSVAIDHPSAPVFPAARGFATAAVALQGVTALFAAAWLGTRSKWRSRILANLAILIAFGLTWYAARETDYPTTLGAMLRLSLPAATGVPAPYALGTIAAFLIPASVLLAGVALLERGHSDPVVAALALALLSHGAFDVPLQALLAVASAQWAMLAMASQPARSRSRDATAG